MLPINPVVSGKENVYSLVTANNPGLPFALNDTTVTLNPAVNDLSAVTVEHQPRNLSFIPSTLRWIDSFQKFIAIGSDTLYSVDGKTWLEATVPVSAMLTYLTYSSYSNKVFAVAADALLSTVDGVTWIQEPLDSQGVILTKVACSPNGHVLVLTQNLLVYKSEDDGQTWTSVNPGLGGSDWQEVIYLRSSVDESSEWYGIIKDSHIYIYDFMDDSFVDAYYSAGVLLASLAYSSTLDTLVANTYTTSSIAVVASGWGNDIPTTWTTVDTGKLGTDEVTWVDALNTYVVYGPYGGLVSADPLDWTEAGEIGIDLRNLEWSVTESVAKAADWNGVYTSSNLVDWEIDLQLYIPIDIHDSACIYDPTLQETIYLGMRGIIGRKDVHNQWRYEESKGLLPCRHVQYVDALGLYLICGSRQDHDGDGSFISKSADLSNWSTTAFTGQWMQQLLWVEELQKVFCVGTGIWSSSDAITWTDNFPTTDANRISRMAWSPSLELMVAGGPQSRLLTSPDGVTWTLQTSPLLNYTYIEWIESKNQFIASLLNTYLLSPDGFNWTLHSFPATRMYPLHIPELDITFSTCYGTAAVYYSKNLIDWIELATPTHVAAAMTRYQAAVWNPAAKRIDVLSGIGVYSFDPVVQATTTVSLTAVLDSGYSGTVDVAYYRPSLVDIAGEEDQLSPITVDTTLYDPENPELYTTDVLQNVAQSLGVRVSDLITIGAVPVPVNENTPQDLAIKVRFDSYLYSGGRYTVKLIAVDTDIALTTIITDPNLLGFIF